MKKTPKTESATNDTSAASPASASPVADAAAAAGTRTKDGSAKAAAPNGEAKGASTHRFEAEVSQVLKLVINSLYSNKEIFLRELLSNASDALDKLRFRAITEQELLQNDPTLEVRIRIDKERHAVIIEDTGIGMTQDELVRNLGTVAHSGTRSFLDKLGDQKKDLNVIGQFGVGFYSSYLVAERVEVISRAAGSGTKAYLWSSDAKDTFTISETTRAERGTEVILYLREDQRSYLDEWTLRNLVTKYSDYVGYPIKVEARRKKKDESGTETEEVKFEQVNKASALWQRPRAEITDEQYDEFFKHLTHDFSGPLARTHFKVEGTQEFVGLLYVPKHKPWDMSDARRRRGVRLFVKRVFIMDDCEEILVPYLRFVRGVIDSDDLPLNVSRELLQDSTILRTIKKNVTKKALDLLEEVAKDKPEDYKGLWSEYGPILKEGLVQGADQKEQERLYDLVRYESSRGEGQVSLAEYVGRMSEKQEAIYYIVSESKATIESSPYLETLKARGYEVLYMTDVIDEWASSSIPEYKGKKLVSAMRADLKLDETDEEKREKERQGESLKTLTARMKKVLDKQVKEIKVSDRLTDSPCCLVLGSHDTSAFMEKILKEHGQAAPHDKRILEVNPMHPLIRSMNELAEKNADDPQLDEWIETLYDQAILTEGGTPADPNKFAKRVASLLTRVASPAPAVQPTA